MATLEIDGKVYQTTSRTGFPAIRQLNRSGGTARWVPLCSALGKRVMRAAGVEPSMAPGFSDGRPYLPAVQPEGGTNA